MIEFLSSNDWIRPQIDFLLFLQNIRVENFEFLNKFFLSVTILGELWLPTIICAVIYWCIDFGAGFRLFSLFGLEMFFTQFFKMIACVYRPWILSDKIKPVDLAITAAKGYSFPSGHSATSSSVLGGVAYLYRKNKILCTFLILTVLLVGFSRMWLGVHTPQDVIVGLTIGFSLVFLISFIFNKLDKTKNGYLYFLVLADILAIAALIYVCYFNQYRIDYIEGQLLVNPAKSIYNFIVCYGYALGLFNGAVICKRFFEFDAKVGSNKSKILRGVIGSVIILLLLKFGMTYIFHNALNYKTAMFISFLIGIFITLFYPLIFIYIEKQRLK